ncbi:MAG: YggS family pyridoxal phosphate-dependent enzyme [Clostridiaceae bacterium]|jgi:pyridoxal phosphate enzyme (YggS family)|nr:YggS family pyridoxal phosphate-dependent enzyme [Clostridiaceae bacterium]
MTESADLIKSNLEAVVHRVNAAAARAGRDPSDIKLIGVTKTIDTARIKAAYDCGISDFGENRVQELCKKADILDINCNWHLIGHLQTNKVKYIIDRVSLIHSLDSHDLAVEINRRAESAGRIADVLVQVNVAGEDSKFGIRPEETLGFIKDVSRMGNIRVKGLMTIAPLAVDPEDVRWVFAGLGKLRIDISRENIDNVDMTCLSMGMSNDFEVAIEEGSNMVRIGTALFGKR